MTDRRGHGLFAFFRRRWSVTAKLLLVTFSIVIAGFLVQSFYHIKDQYDVRLEALGVKAELLADMHAAALAGPVWHLEPGMISTAMEGLRGVEEFRAARIVSTTGEEIIALGQVPEDEPTISARRNIVWTSEGQTRLLGHFDITLSRADADQIVKSELVQTGVAALAFVAIIMASVYIAFRSLTKPLDELNHRLRRLAHGERDMDVPHLGRNDEIGRIAEAVQVFKDNSLELDQLRSDLEQQVRLQTSELRTAKDEAERANSAKSEFLSSMSHELRTPLNAIMGFAQLLEMDSATSTQRQKDAAGQILRSSRQLLELITQVLDLSRIETGHLEMTLTDVTLDEVLRTALDTARPIAEAANIELVRAASPCWHTMLHVDPTLVRQALLNLITNGVKYNKPGGRVALGCAVAAGEGKARISVVDNGRGIAPELADQLFLPFTRLGAEGSVIEGTGIGLTITKNLINWALAELSSTYKTRSVLCT
ncbi:histidine kinase dimerization/phospho-acceptor domain-containing protein [Pseudomonadota bacterium]